MPKTRVDLKLAARLVATGALAVAFVGAAHANSPLFSQTILESLQSSHSANGISPLGGTTNLGSLTGASGANTSTGGFSGGFTSHVGPPSAVPEPVTMSLAVVGLGIAFRRARRMAK